MRFAPLIPLVVMAVHALLFWSAGPFDDDYICYRYARNLIEGNGLVFQSGFRVEGFTNPLWVMLIAGALKFGIDPAVFSRVVGLLASLACVWAVDRTWRERGGKGHVGPALVVAALSPFAWHSMTGLGTTLMAAGLALWAREWNRDRILQAGLWLALACGIRQEAALFAIPFAWSNRKQLGAWLPIAVLAGWTLFRLTYYGRLMPMPWHVKKLPLVEDWGYGLTYLWKSTLTSGIAIWVILGLAAKGRGRTLAILVLVHTLYVVHVGGDFMALARFHVPVLPLAVLFGWEGFSRFGKAGTGAAITLGVGCLWVNLPWSNEMAEEHPIVLECAHRFRHMDHEGFEQRWLMVGAALGERFPGASVATSPIGAIGWTSRMKVLDILGLTNESTLEVEPELERIRVKGHHRSNAEWILAHRPEVMLLGNAVVTADGKVPVNPWEWEIYTSLDFQRDYVLQTLPIEGSYPLRTWIRADLAE